MEGRRLTAIGLALVLVVAVAGSWAYAQDGGVMYYACVNNSSGTIHMLQGPDDTCSNNEEYIAWNSEGPSGPQGPAGPAGPPGPQGEPGACDITRTEFDALQARVEILETGCGPESCNGVDDDCDGQVDEDWDFTTDPNNCGGCGIVCGAGETCSDEGGQSTCVLGSLYITYIQPAVQNDPKVYSLQHDPQGPALIFTTYTGSPPFEEFPVGAEVSFDIVSTMYSYNGMWGVDAIDDITWHEFGFDVTQLTQDVTDVANLITDIEDYQAELVSLSFTMLEDFSAHPDDMGFSWASIQTPAGAGSPGSGEHLSLRVPDDVRDSLGLSYGCTARVSHVPLWGAHWLTNWAQVRVYDASEVSDVVCP